MTFKVVAVLGLVIVTIGVTEAGEVVRPQPYTVQPGVDRTCVDVPGEGIKCGRRIYLPPPPPPPPPFRPSLGQIPTPAIQNRSITFRTEGCGEFALPTNLLAYIQEALKLNGVFNGLADGRFNQETVEALAEFRKKQRLSSMDGPYVDITFLKALMGADFEKIADRELRLHCSVRTSN